MRIGLVLSLNGGLLKPIALSVKYFLGTWFGNGGNIYSWIHIDDLCELLLIRLVGGNQLAFFE